jgi:hypothetical protein
MPKKPSAFTIALLGSTTMFLVGGWAFVYAHYHDPTPESDPEAVHLLSHANYELLHYGGLALMAAGLLAGLWAVFSAMRSSP